MILKTEMNPYIAIVCISVIDCGDPESLYDDLVNVTLDLINGTTTYNSVIQVTCADGLVPIGQTTWTCDRHGKWTKPWNFLCAGRTVLFYLKYIWLYENIKLVK